MWAMNEKIWALRKGLLCGRHVCFVFTHTGTCQTNNTLLPPPTCNDESGFRIASLNFLPVSEIRLSGTRCWMKGGKYHRGDKKKNTVLVMVDWLIKILQRVRRSKQGSATIFHYSINFVSKEQLRMTKCCSGWLLRPAAAATTTGPSDNITHRAWHPNYFLSCCI